MKPILEWVKQNLIVVICLVVIVSVLPTAFIISSGMNRTLRQNQETAATGELSRVTGARVSYALPAFEPGVEPVSLTRAPNAEVTAWFRAERERLTSAAGQVVTRITDFNRGVGPDAQGVGRTPHGVMVQGLFPAPPAGRQEADAKIFEMAGRLLGVRGNPNPYQAMLNGIRAGGPADPVRVLDVLRAVQLRERQQIAAAREPTREELARIARTLREQRLGQYVGHANQLSVFATLDAFPFAGPGGATRGIPRGTSLPSEAENVESMFLWQWDAWVYADLLAAVRVANTPAGATAPLPVAQAPVKRIERIELETPAAFLPRADAGMGEEFGGGASPPPEPAPGMVPLDFNVSFTGRESGPWNTLYDVRRARVTLVVASARLPDVIQAFSKTNLMTVTGVQVGEVDVWADLQQGFFYGTDHVVRATLDVETLWLRSWTVPLMPAAIRTALGVPEDPPADGG